VLLIISLQPVEGKAAAREAGSLNYDPFGLIHNGKHG
jgi:hypothetical protein